MPARGRLRDEARLGLSDRKFPVEHLAIVGCDLRLVEQVTGRLTVARAALAGAGTGAWFGFLIGLVFWIVSPWAAGGVAAGVILDAVFGAVYGAVAHAATRGRRDFSAVRQLTATRYELHVDENVASNAEQLLTAYPVEPATADTPAAPH